MIAFNHSTRGRAQCFRAGKGLLLTVALLVGVASPVQADIVDDVPGDAWAALVIRNLNELDRKLMTTQQQLQVPAQSMLGLLKGHLMLQSVNDGGAAAIVMMPAMNIMAPQEGLALMIPCEDYNAMMQPMAPQDLGDGTSKVLLAGEESYAAPIKGYAVLAENPGAVKAILAAEGNPGVRGKWTRHQLDRFARDDITLYVNMEAIIASPGVQGMMGMLAAMPNGQQQIEQFNAYRALGVGLRFDKPGISLGIYGSFKDGTQPAGVLATTPSTKESLLTGLPADNYVLAFGTVGSKESWTNVANQLASSFNNPMMAMQLKTDPAKLSELVQIVSDMLRVTRSVSFGVSSLAAGSDGMVSLTKVIGVEGDAAKQCSRVAEMIQLVSSGFVPGEAAKQAMEHVKYSAAVESIDGVSVDQLTIAVDQMPGAEQDWVQALQKIFGREGLTIRMAAVDDKHLAVSFGGGKARMEQSIAICKAGGAPLSSDASIRKSAGMLPASRNVEGYVNADNLMRLMTNVSKAVDETPPPAFPKVGVPAAMVAGPVGESGYQVDLALPTELIVAIKDYALAFQMSQAQAGGSDG